MPGDPHPVLADYQDEMKAKREKQVKNLIHAIVSDSRQLKNERKGVAWLRSRDEIAQLYLAKWGQL